MAKGARSVDRSDPDFFAFYEVWASAEAHAAHDRTEHVRALVVELPVLAAQPARVLRLRPIEPS